MSGLGPGLTDLLTNPFSSPEQEASDHRTCEACSVRRVLWLHNLRLALPVFLDVDNPTLGVS